MSAVKEGVIRWFARAYLTGAEQQVLRTQDFVNFDSHMACDKE